MSPTTDDLRERLSSDLDGFGALPSVADRALLQGRRTRRRRGVAVAALGVVAASVGVGALASGGGRTATPADPVTPTTPPTPSITLPSEPPGAGSDPWNADVVETLSALLPDRYGDVRLHRGQGFGGVSVFRTVGGVQELEIFFVFTQGSMYGYDLHTCADDLWWMSSCEVTKPNGAWQGRVFHQKVGTDEEGSGPVVGKPAAWHFGGGAELGVPGSDVTWSVFPVDDRTPLGLTDAELLSIVEAPAFQALLDAGRPFSAP